MPTFTGEPLGSARLLAGTHRLAAELRQIRQEMATSPALYDSPLLQAQLRALENAARSFVFAVVGQEGCEASVAAIVERRAPWLHCHEIARAARHLACSNLACKEPPLRLCLDVLESKIQTFKSAQMSSEAWMLQTQEKICSGATSRAIAEFASAAKTMDLEVLLDRAWEFVTADVPLKHIIAAFHGIPDRLKSFSPEQQVRLVAALASAAGRQDQHQPDLQDMNLVRVLVQGLMPALVCLQPNMLANLGAAVSRLRCDSVPFIMQLLVIIVMRRKDFGNDDFISALCTVARLSSVWDGFAKSKESDFLAEEIQLRSAHGQHSPADAARLSCVFALMGKNVKALFNNLCSTAFHQEKRWMLEAPFAGDTACSPCCPRALPLSWPVQVINLDRNPARRAAMTDEVGSLGVIARRFPAIDGRRRIHRRSLYPASSKNPDAWLKDLPTFDLQEDEPHPTMGLALTSQSEQHFIGYVGSFLSHFSSARRFVEEGFPFTVILEDDQTLHPDFNDVVNDIAVCAGDKFDVVNLGPLDWRYRTLEYAQKRKIMRLRVPLPDFGDLRSEEERYMNEVLQRKPQLSKETTYFLYWIGDSSTDPESTGSAGAWGYMVSRSGSQWLTRHMQFMWESYDDQLQAVLQGHDWFTEGTGQRRLWAVFPPLVTSDGTWPSANVGDDLTQGRQTEPVSPHSSFRDATLFHPMAKLILGPAPGEGARGASCQQVLNEEVLLRVSATALAWPSVGSEWVLQPRGWKSLFEHRRGSNSELQKELQIQLQIRPAMLSCATESLALSWTIISAVRQFNISLKRHLRIVVLNPGQRECFCPHATFRDLVALAHADVTVVLVGPNVHEPPAAAEQLSCFRTPEQNKLIIEHVQDAAFEMGSIRGVNLAVAFGASLETFCGPVLTFLRQHKHVVVTTCSRELLVEGLRRVRSSVGTAVVNFAGRNAFSSKFGLAGRENEEWVGGDLAHLPDAQPDEKDDIVQEATEALDSHTMSCNRNPPENPNTTFWIGLS